MKTAPKTALGYMGAAPGASTLWRLQEPPPGGGSQNRLPETALKTAPKSGYRKAAPKKRLPAPKGGSRAALPFCGMQGGFLCKDVCELAPRSGSRSRQSVAAPGAAPGWRLPRKWLPGQSTAPETIPGHATVWPILFSCCGPFPKLVMDGAFLRRIFVICGISWPGNTRFL